MPDGHRTRRRNSTLPFYLGTLLLVLAAAIAFASYSVELGISKPGTSARRVAVAVAEIDSALQSKPETTTQERLFLEFSEALRAGIGAHRGLAVYNAADNRVDHASGRALDCYKALREAWQIELEGDWDPTVHGNRGYWRSFHDAVQLPGRGTMTSRELREALRQEARAYSAEAMKIVER